MSYSYSRPFTINTIGYLFTFVKIPLLYSLLGLHQLKDNKVIINTKIQTPKYSRIVSVNNFSSM